MPIWGVETRLTWRQVLPPALAALAVLCLAYGLYSCLRRERPGVVRDEEQRAFYLAQLRSGDPFARAGAVQWLGQRGDRELVPELRKRLDDEDHTVVGAACVALARLGDDRSTDTFVRLLSDEASIVRARAAEALGVLRWTDAVPELLKLLQASDSATRLAAIAALAEIGDEAAVPHLEFLREFPAKGLEPAPPKAEVARHEQAVKDALAKLRQEK